MTEFTDLIKSGYIRKAYSQRKATLNEISQNVLSIKELDQENPNSMTFNRLESNANKSLDELKLAIQELYILLDKANPDIVNDESYIADQKLVREQQFSLFNVIDEYIQLLYSKEIPYPPEVKPVTSSGDLAAILNNLVASQNSLVASQDKNAVAQDKIMTTLDKNLTAMVASQDKNVADLSKNLVDQIKSQASNSRSGPKAAQPKFKSKGNDSDYGEFKDFLSKFEIITAKCSCDLEKL